jgi:hypothetical protein
VGGANTLVTAVAFYTLAAFVRPRIAFTIVYLAGLAFVVLVTPNFVFGSHASGVRRVLLALWYVGTYLVGIAVIFAITAVASAPRSVVVVSTVLLTAPLSFVGGRVLVGGRPYAPGSASSTGGSTPSG